MIAAITSFSIETGASIAAPIALPGANQVKTYGLDGLGNWKTSNFTLVGSDETTTSTAEARAHNYVNEITGITDTVGSGSPTTTPFVYDKNGNLLNDGIRLYQYDAFNRLIQVNSATGDQPLLATYLYDSFNRRAQKTITNGGLTGDITNGTTLYFYDGEQVVEERNVSAYNVWTKVYFWGQYIDELLFFAIPGESTPTTYRVLSDLLYRSVAIVTTSNVITEAYDTDAYGNTLCYSGPGTDDLWFTNDDVTTHNPINTTIFTGRQYDPESQIYYYRARYYSPNIGRFISRDPLENAELVQGPNLYEYVWDNPVNDVDPLGLQGVLVIPEAEGVEAAIDWYVARQAAAAAAKKAAQALAAAIATCEALYNSYANQVCKACLPCDKKPVLLAKIACWEIVEKGRSAYLSAGCDNILPGSISKGVQQAIAGHTQQLLQVQTTLQNCRTLLANAQS